MTDTDKGKATPLLAKWLVRTHGVGALSAFGLLLGIGLDYSDTKTDHLIKTEIYTRSVGFVHPCGALPPDGNATTYFSGCISKDTGVDNKFTLVPGTTTEFATVSPYMALLAALTFSLIYHALLAINFAVKGYPITTFLEDNLKGRGGGRGAKYFKSTQASLKTLRTFRNIMVGVPLVWSIMCLVGVGELWDYILIGGLHLGLFTLLAQWDRDPGPTRLFDAAGYATLAVISSWYVIAATNHEDDTLSAAVPSHFQLSLVSGVHTAYIFLYGLHLLFLRSAGIKFLGSITDGLEAIWDVQVDIGFAILNVGYLITTVFGVYANYKEISKAVFKPVYPDFVDDVDWYQRQDIATGVTTTVVLVAVVTQTFAFKYLLASTGIFGGEGSATAKEDYGYVRSKYSTNAQPHEGEPILGEQYDDEA